MDKYTSYLILTLLGLILAGVWTEQTQLDHLHQDLISIKDKQ